MDTHREAGSIARRMKALEARSNPGFAVYGAAQMRSTSVHLGEINMNRLHTAQTRTRLGWVLLAWVTLCAALFAGEASAALTLSPSAVAVPLGGSATVKISGGSGEIQAESKNTSVVTVALSNRTTTGATLTLYGKGAGTATVYVRDKVTSNISLPVTVAVTKSMTVSPTSLALDPGASGKLTASNYSGSLSARSANPGIATVSLSGNIVTVKGITAGSTLVSVRDSKVTVNVPVTVRNLTASTAKYTLIAWNDLGMHCMDGIDYSVFSILPPYNNLNAQLVNASTGKVVTSGVTLTYESMADATGSINTSSAGKTDFWTHVLAIYGAAPAANVGLTGNITPSLTPRTMAFSAAHGWFEATGLPITPYDDAGHKNFYPMVKVVAKDSTGKVLATTATVLPVSDEITCAACHASRCDDRGQLGAVGGRARLRAG